MASPALAVLAALASRRSRFFFRARAFLPYIALDEWIFLYACRARVVVRRGFRESVYSNEEDWTWTPPGQKRTKEPVRLFQPFFSLLADGNSEF